MVSVSQIKPERALLLWASCTFAGCFIDIDVSRLDSSMARTDGGVTSCPVEMALVQGFCIDRSAVTRGEYLAFLDANHTAQSGRCVHNRDFIPSSSWPPAGDEAAPVRDVDQCDARAFCEQADRRLCGRIGGGTLAPSSAADAVESEWMSACTTSPELFDTGSGSEEWTDACEEAAPVNGANDLCAALRCGGAPVIEKRSKSAPTRGFRCCSP